MRIYFIGQKGIPVIYGGVERHVDELATRLAQGDNEVFAYARSYYNPTKLTEYKGVKIITLPTIRTKHVDAIFHSLIATIHVLFKKVDVIHYHSIGPAFLAWIPRLFKPSAKVVFTFHCADYEHKKWGWFARMSLRLGEWIGCKYADEIITVSQGLQKYVKETYGRDAVYIPNGSADVTPETESDLLDEWDLKPKKYILVVSRLIRHKGIHYLIEAFNNIKTDQKLVIVGDSVFTDDYVKQLHSLAKGNDNIIFTGWQSGRTLSQLLSHATVFVQPSEQEGLSIALLEALQHSLPVIASNIPENEEVLKDKGLYFENKNSDDLADKLGYLLEQPKLLEEMAIKGKQMVRVDYNWDTIVKTTQELYEQDLNDDHDIVYRAAPSK